MAIIHKATISPTKPEILAGAQEQAVEKVGGGTAVAASLGR